MGKCPKENECKHYGADCSDGGPVEGCFQPHTTTTIAKETRKQIVDRWLAQGCTDLIRMTKSRPQSDLHWLSGETIHWRSRGYNAEIFYYKKTEIAGYWAVPFNADIDKDWGRCLMAWYRNDRKKAKDLTKQKIKATE